MSEITIKRDTTKKDSIAQPWTDLRVHFQIEANRNQCVEVYNFAKTFSHSNGCHVVAHTTNETTMEAMVPVGLDQAFLEQFTKHFQTNPFN